MKRNRDPQLPNRRYRRLLPAVLTIGALVVPGPANALAGRLPASPPPSHLRMPPAKAKALAAQEAKIRSDQGTPDVGGS